MWLTCPYHSGLLHWHWGNHMIAPVPVKQPWMASNAESIPMTFLLCTYFVMIILLCVVEKSGLFAHIVQGCFTGTGAIIGLSRCQLSNPQGPVESRKYFHVIKSSWRTQGKSEYQPTPDPIHQLWSHVACHSGMPHPESDLKSGKHPWGQDKLSV